MGNPFVHVDLSTGDLAAAKKFYQAVFDWAFVDMPEMGWSGVAVGDGTGGGMGTKQSPEEPTVWTPYVGVDDIHDTLNKVEKSGGKVIVPYTEIGEMGALAVFVDPQGATLGLWKSFAPPAPAKKAPAKKAPAKKAPAKKAPAKKAPAKKAPAKKAPAKKAPAKKAPAKKTGKRR